MNILGIWLASFILGQLAGHSRSLTGLQVGIFNLMCVFLLVIYLYRSGRIYRTDLIAKGLVAAGALTWGFHTSFRYIPNSHAPATIAIETIFANGETDLAVVISTAEQQVFAKGGGHPGDVGNLRTKCRSAAIDLCFTNFTLLFPGSTPLKQTHIVQLVSEIRQSAKQRLALSQYGLRHWLQAIILGDLSEMTQDELDIFKRTGLLHILVVSGFHVSVFAIVIYLLVQLPFRCLYACRLVPPNLWMVIKPGLTVVSIFLVAFYVCILGLSPPSQRAFILFLISNLALLFVGCLPGSKRMLLSCVLQTIAFPLGFLSTSTFLSWIAYLFVVPLGERRRGWRMIVSLLALQLRITLLSLAIFGSFSAVGIFANLILVPFFPLVYAVALLVLFPLPFLKDWLTYGDTLQYWYIRIIAVFSELSFKYKWLYVGEVTAATQWLGILTISVFILNQLREMTIRGEAREKKRSERTIDE